MLRRMIPMVLLALISAGGVWAGSPRVSHQLAQVGAGGGIQSVLLVFNPGEEETPLVLRFFTGDGSPLEVTIGETSASVFELLAPGGGTARFEITSSSSNPLTGWASLSSFTPVAVQLLFEIVHNGRLVTRAAVESAEPTRVADLFVDTLLGNTGVALANVSPLGPIVVQFQLKDDSGEVVGVVDREVAPLGHLSVFISELFPEAERLRGSIAIGSTGPIALVTLQQQGLVLGTLPVVIPTS